MITRFLRAPSCPWRLMNSSGPNRKAVGLYVSHFWHYHWRQTNSFSGAIEFMIRRVDVRVAVLASFVLLSVTLTFSQQKERNRNSETAQKNAPAPPAPSAQNDKHDKNEGDPLFKGMKYRSIVPFRCGRSLTADGIPRDPA